MSRLALLSTFALLLAAPTATRAAVRVAESGPASDDVAAAIRLRRPDVDVRRAGRGEPGDVLVGLDKQPGGWLLTLQRAPGAETIERALPAGPEFASACAVIVDRYLEQPRFTVAGADALASAPVLARASSTPIDWTLGVGVAGIAGLDRPGTGGGALLSVHARRSPLRAGATLRAQAGASRTLAYEDSALQRSVNVGRVTSNAFALFVSAGACTTDATIICASLVAGPMLSWTSIAGAEVELREQRTALAAGAAAGLELAAIRELSRTLQARAELLALAKTSSSVSVEGAGAALRAPNYEIGLAFSLAWHLR